MGSNSELSGCGKCLKLFFILLNLLYLLIGIALIATGSYLIASGNSLSVFTGNHFLSGAAILIICGIVAFVITAVGIAGAFFQWKFVLYLYIIVVVIIIILEIVATILGFVYRGTITETAQNNAVDAVSKYFKEGEAGYDEGINKGVDFVQREFKCCGWGNNSIWLTSPYYETTMMFPESCLCANETAPCYYFDDDQKIYNDTCNDGLSNALRRSVAIVGGVGVTFAIAQVIPVLIAIGILYSIHKTAEYVTV